VTTPVAEFREVRKQFGELLIFEKFDFIVNRGEKLALIGPSGSGKTTVLRILMGLEPIQGGVVYLEGEPLTHEFRKGRLVPASKRHQRRLCQKVGMVFQQFNLFPHMSVLRNVTEAPIHVKGTSRDRAEAEAMRLLAMVGLDDRADARPHQLSGGQQQRVAIARALALHPRVLLFDEPTSALDPELVGEVLQVIDQLRNERDLAMLLVTHEMWFAERFADRICFFDAGRVVEEGPPGEVLRRPRQPRTRRFLRAVLDHEGSTDSPS
jgi:polar amino acid transport system ATP-binding protein